jgi:parvulin-like peptidyl-prolyl isomerase
MGNGVDASVAISRWALPVESLRLLANQQLVRPYLRQTLLATAVADQTLSDEQRQQALISFAQQRGLHNQEKIENFCQAHLLTPQAFAQQVELPLRVQHHCRQHFLAKAEARFLERKHQLDQVVYSLLRLQNEGLSRELFLQLQDESASFAELAAQYSEGPEKLTRGIIGPVALNQAHPLLVQRLQTADVGVLVEPFQIEQWWLVMRLESSQPASFDEHMAIQMSQELFEEWLEQQVDLELQELRPLLLPKAVDVQP